jgi:hypothetical protein
MFLCIVFGANQSSIGKFEDKPPGGFPRRLSIHVILHRNAMIVATQRDSCHPKDSVIRSRFSPDAVQLLKNVTFLTG